MPPAADRKSEHRLTTSTHAVAYPRTSVSARSGKHSSSRSPTSVVAGGFAGCVLAERLVSPPRQARADRRSRCHIGGNAYDRHDAAGVLVHRYGLHIFCTNSQRVLGYLSQFTSGGLTSTRCWDGRWAADAHTDQAHHHQPPVRAQARRGGCGQVPGGARASGRSHHQLTRRRGESSGRRALPQVVRRLHSNGASIPRSSTGPSPRARRREPMRTTAASTARCALSTARSTSHGSSR